MEITTPSAFTKIASEIANSWSDIGSNFVLVAPPLCEPDYIFKLLKDPRFLRNTSIDPSALAIAYLPPSSYSSSSEFVQRTLQCWNIDLTYELSGTFLDGDLEILEDALDKLQEQGKVAVILLPQFHKSIERLSWTLGARLRELEINFSLCTVVELPVPLSQLRDRWQLIDDKENFICSDFGQGHSVITLTGYTAEEINKIGKNLDLSKESIEVIRNWTGGLPALVKWLIREAKLGKNSYELESVAKKGAAEQSKRFLNWIDTPETDIYKTHIADLSRGINEEAARLSIREHVWNSLLIDKRGKLLSETINYACRTQINLDCGQALVLIAELTRQGKRENVKNLITKLSDACRAEVKTRTLLAIIPTWCLATGLSPNWDKIEAAAVKGLKELRTIKDACPGQVLGSLERWKSFAREINQFQFELKATREKNWRLSDSLSGRGNGSDLAAIQMVIYRLSVASKDSDKISAMKSILEIPEQILQIYCGRKLKISVWDAPRFDETDIEEVNKIWQAGKFSPPKQKSRIGFTQLLYLGWIKMRQLSENERLFRNLEELLYWQESYTNTRNQPSHSITLETEADWEDFYQNCIHLADRLAASLVGETNEDILPQLDSTIELIVKNYP